MFSHRATSYVFQSTRAISYHIVAANDSHENAYLQVLNFTDWLQEPAALHKPIHSLTDRSSTSMCNGDTRYCRSFMFHMSKNPNFVINIYLTVYRKVLPFNTLLLSCGFKITIFLIQLWISSKQTLFYLNKLFKPDYFWCFRLCWFRFWISLYFLSKNWIFVLLDFFFGRGRRIQHNIFHTTIFTTGFGKLRFMTVHIW